ncbi:MAG: AAA family ATPase [Dehalococcoidales bacterium]|nr:AAA family ATPase [Dehalococcoidales bacterium]
MKLQQFRAQKFRCLYDSGWITINNPTVLIGCNDGGKTATINALDYFFGNVVPPIDAYSYVRNVAPNKDGERPRESEIILEAIFTLSKQEEQLLLDILLSPPNKTIHIRKTFNQSDTAVVSSIKSSVPKNPDLPRDVTSLQINSIREYLRKLGIPNPGGNEKLPLQEALRKWLITQPLEEDWLPIPASIVKLYPIYQKVEGEDSEQTIFQILNVIYRQLLKDPKTETLLSTFVNDFDRLLKQPLIDRAKNLVEFISAYLPDIVQAEVMPKFQVNPRFDSAPLTLVGKESARIDLSARGAGTKQQVNLAVFEWSSEMVEPGSEGKSTDTILAFDEPDLHLDYEAQKRLYRAIESYIDKEVQVIVSTHSLNFINRVPIQCICHYSKPAGKLDTTIEYLHPQSDDPEESAFFIDRLGESIGFDNATILYERCFLAFEGPTEQSALPILFRIYANDSLFRCGIRLVNCYNQYGAIVFAKFMHRNGRHVIFLVDQDTTINKGTKRLLTTSTLEKAGFSIAEQVHIIGPECFEYSFSNEIWTAVLNVNQPDSKNDWTPAKIEPYRQGAKKFLDSMETLLQNDNKPEIGLMLAKSVTKADHIPEIIRKCFDKAIEKAAQ